MSANTDLRESSMGTLRGFLDDAGTHRGRLVTITTEDARAIARALDEHDALRGRSDRASARIADLEEAVRRAADYLTSAADVIADGPDHDEEDERLAREFIEELRALAPARGDEP